MDLGYFHTFITSEAIFNLKSIVSNGLIPGGQDLSRRQSVFFLLVDPRKEDHKDPEYVDYSVPRLARYLQNTWKRHQDTENWVDIDLGIKEGLKFYQIRSNATILQGTLPANFIVRAEKIENWRKIVSKAISISSSTTEDLFEARISIGPKGIMNWALQLNIDQSRNTFNSHLERTLQLGSSKPTQFPKPIEDRSGRPVAQEIVGKSQEELSSSDRPGRPATEEEQHVRNHDSSGKPDREETQHTVQEDCHPKYRDKEDKFDLATDDANVDFNISGISDEAVKRSETFNILQLIRRITRHPQQQAVQDDLDKQQSFNEFSDESKVAIMEAGNIEISEIVNADPKWQCKFCLNHCSAGVIYCQCGRLMTKDAAENKRKISDILDTFSHTTFLH